MMDFTRELIQLRQSEDVLARKDFLTGAAKEEGQLKDVIWWNPEGREMSQDDWNAGYIRCFGMWLPGETLEELDQDGSPRQSRTVLVLSNGHYEESECILPQLEKGNWQFRLSTVSGEVNFSEAESTGKLTLPARSMVVYTANA